jgi:DNA-binding IclR family transcriptional regulator
MGRQDKNGMLRLDETEVMLKSSFRTMALFEYFADARAPVTIGDISANLNIPQSSASVLVKSLLESGYLTKTATNRHYTPTLRLPMLSGWMDSKALILPQLTNIMQRLCTQFQETFVLAMRNGIYSQYIMVEAAGGIIRQHVATGSLRPLLCASTGWAMLARDTDDYISKLIRRTRNETDNNYWRETAKNAPAHIAISLPSHDAHYSLALAAAGTRESIGQKKEGLTAELLKLASQFNRDITAQILGTPNLPT